MKSPNVSRSLAGHYKLIQKKIKNKVEWSFTIILFARIIFFLPSFFFFQFIYYYFLFHSSYLLGIEFYSLTG